MPSPRSALAAVVLPVMLAACGGGGGGPDAANDAPSLLDHADAGGAMDVANPLDAATDDAAADDAATDDTAVLPDVEHADTATDAGACPPHATVCEDFEHGPPAAPDWTLTTNGGATATVETTRAEHGTHSLHIAAGAFHGTAFMTETATFAGSAGSAPVWGRAFMYFVTPLPNAHATLVDVHADTPQNVTWRYGIAHAKWQADFVTTVTTSHEMALGSTTSPRTGAWLCVEWQVDSATHTGHWYIDGAEVADVAVSAASWLSPPWQRMDIGWQHYEQDDAASGYEYWLDDVAAGPARIGCTP